MSQTPCEFVQDVFTIPYVPNADVISGQVIVLASSLVTISKLNISSGKDGDLSIAGMFRVPKVTGAVTAFQKLYYDNDADPVDGTAGSGAFTTNAALGPFAGWADKAGAGSDDEMVNLILHSTPGMQVNGVAGGYKVARGSAALDGGNPTPIATGLSTIVAAIACLNGSTAPGDNTSALTVGYTGSDGTLNVYAWKNTGGSDPTLVASTGTENFDWIAFGT